VFNIYSKSYVPNRSLSHFERQDVKYQNFQADLRNYARAVKIATLKTKITSPKRCADVLSLRLPYTATVGQCTVYRILPWIPLHCEYIAFISFFFGRINHTCRQQTDRKTTEQNREKESEGREKHILCTADASDAGFRRTVALSSSLRVYISTVCCRNTIDYFEVTDRVSVITVTFVPRLYLMLLLFSHVHTRLKWMYISFMHS